MTNKEAPGSAVLDLIGSFPASWTRSTLSDACSLVTDGTHNSPREAKNGYPLVTGKCITNRRIDFSKAYLISAEDHYAVIARSKPEYGDILFANIGNSVGDLARVETHEEFSIKNVALFKPSEKLDSLFLKYYLLCPTVQNYIKNSTFGSAQPFIGLATLRSFPIPLPSMPEQRFIGETLGALDAKIELNRCVNQTLEYLGRVMFLQWLVDGEENDWEEKSLDEIAAFLNGLALQKFPPENHDYLPVIKIAQLRKNDTKDADKASINIPSEYIIQDGDILFSWSGSLEVVIWCGGRGALNQHLFKVKSENYPKWFYYYWTKYHLPSFQEIAAGKATTMGHIQRHHLRDAKVLVPNAKELKEMDKVMSPILEKIINNEKESRPLASLRDRLLPKLMKGEVHI